MPDTHESLDFSTENDLAVEPALKPELAPEEAEAELDQGPELDLARAGFPAASRLGQAGSVPNAWQAQSLRQAQRRMGNFAVQRMLKRVTAPPAPGVRPNPAVDGDDWLAERIEDASGNGQVIEPGAQARLEAGLQSGLGDVRVHTDHKAADLAVKADAVAFTSGRDIFFGPGAYQPGTSQGLELLAHEAAHTVQQASGPVAGTPAAGGVLNE